MKSNNARFAEEPREEPYGAVAVFFDLYGNKWNILGTETFGYRLIYLFSIPSNLFFTSPHSVSKME